MVCVTFKNPVVPHRELRSHYECHSLNSCLFWTSYTIISTFSGQTAYIFNVSTGGKHASLCSHVIFYTRVTHGTFYTKSRKWGYVTWIRLGIRCPFLTQLCPLYPNTLHDMLCVICMFCLICWIHTGSRIIGMYLGVNNSKNSSPKGRCTQICFVLFCTRLGFKSWM